MPEYRRPAPRHRLVKPYALERLESFAARLWAANGISEKVVSREVERSRVRHTEWSQTGALEALVEGCAGLPAGYFDNVRRAAQPVEGVHYYHRNSCSWCTGGQSVPQFPHDRANLCLLHGKWVGPGTSPTHQPVMVIAFDAELRDAERRHRAWTAEGRFNAFLTQRAWEMVRDNAFLSETNTWSPRLTDAMGLPGATREVEGRAALYPETVAVAELLTDTSVLATCLDPSIGSAQLRARLTAALPFDGNVCVLIERMVLHLLPARARARRHLDDPTWRAPRWPHEQDLSGVDDSLWKAPHPEEVAVDVGAIIDVSHGEYNELIGQYPGVILEWNWEGSESVTPWDPDLKATRAFEWRCRSCGFRWTATIGSRTRGRGCPACAGRVVHPGVTDLATVNPALAAEWDHTPGVNSKTPEVVTANSNYKAGWLCKTCGWQWKSAVSARTRGSGCPACSGNVARPGVTDLATVNPALAAEWDHTPGVNSKTPENVTASSNQKVGWLCKTCGWQWKATVSNRTCGNGCPACSGKVARPGVTDLATVNPALAAEWDHTPGANSTTPQQVTANSGKKIAWVCEACGHGWRADVSSRSRGSGCPVCARTRRRAKGSRNDY